MNIHKTHTSIEDIKNELCKKKFIFREFKKSGDKFIAMNKFFVSEEIDEGKLEFISIKLNKLDRINDYEKIIPESNIKNDSYIKNIKNLYISLNSMNENNIFYNRQYIDLIIISNISFQIDETTIDKTNIIKKMLFNDSNNDANNCENNDANNCENFLEDLYYNEDFSKKINIELPKKYGNNKIILENEDIYKKYLFKMNFTELSLNCQEQNSRYTDNVI